MLHTIMKIIRLPVLLPAICLLVVAALAHSAQAAQKWGDVDGDDEFGMPDLQNLFDLIRVPMTQLEAVDINSDGRFDVYDPLTLLLHMRWMGSDRDQEFQAVVTIGDHLLDEPFVKDFMWIDGNGERKCEYRISSNREISSVEFIIDGDTLREMSGVTPVLMKVDPDTIENDLQDFFAVSDPKHWELKLWDTTGDYYEQTWESRYSCLKTQVIDISGSPNTGLPVDFPLVLYGPWQRFALVHPKYDSSFKDQFLPVDLNPSGADSIVFENIDSLSFSIMEQIVTNLSMLDTEDVQWDNRWGPYCSPAMTVETNEKTSRLIFLCEYPWTGGYIEAVPLDGNERLLSALGLPSWMKNMYGVVFNTNYKLDPEVFEKYKDRFY
jgi:hypothetical protein